MIIKYYVNAEEQLRLSLEKFISKASHILVCPLLTVLQKYSTFF